MYNPPPPRGTAPWTLVVLVLVLATGAAALRLRDAPWRMVTAPETLPAIERVRSARLVGVTAEALDEIRADPSAIGPLFDRCRGELQEALGERFASLSDQELRYVFCTMVAYEAAPYGPGGGSTIDELLHAETLQCASYGPLAWSLFGRCEPDPADGYTASFVGWDGGAVGNHQVTFYARRDGSLSMFLDATIGMVARVDFDDIASGRPVDADNVVVLGHRPDIESFRRKVVDAVVAGRFRPSDLLYYFEGIEHLRTNYGNPHHWPTPGAVDWRASYRAANPG